MGLLDWFRRRGEAPPAPSSRQPEVPCRARIESFDSTDAVGTLLLPNGTSLRFGRSACRGFEPVPELEVTIAAAGPHPLGGYRATELTLESDSATYDALLAQRDAALGSVPLDRTQVIETAAATAEVLGWIVVLLDKAPPASPVAFRSWAQSLGLLDRGLRVIGCAGFTCLAAHGLGRAVHLLDDLFLQLVGALT